MFTDFSLGCGTERLQINHDFLRNIFSKIMTPDLGNIIQWKTRPVNGQIISGLKVLPNVLAVIKGIIQFTCHIFQIALS
jgi:hypothetical protein